MGGAGRIPWSKAITYAERAGVASPDEQGRFWRMISAMDGTYLEWIDEQAKAATEKSKNKS